MAECPSWREERARLRRAVGEDLSAKSLVRSMAESADKWEAVSKFAEAVMGEKEAAERAREEAARRELGLRGGPRSRKRRGSDTRGGRGGEGGGRGETGTGTRTR